MGFKFVGSGPGYGQAFACSGNRGRSVWGGVWGSLGLEGAGLGAELCLHPNFRFY